MCGNINVYFLTIKYGTILINEPRHVKLFTDPSHVGAGVLDG
jgi:hypothetical protein